MYTAFFYSLVVNNVEELKLLFYPNPTSLSCTGAWSQSSVHCRFRCLLFREEDAYTYLYGVSLNVVVKINLIFPGIELQSLNSVLLLSWIPLFLNGGGQCFRRSDSTTGRAFREAGAEDGCLP